MWLVACCVLFVGVAVVGYCLLLLWILFVVVDIVSWRVCCWLFLFVVYVLTVVVRWCLFVVVCCCLVLFIAVVVTGVYACCSCLSLFVGFWFVLLRLLFVAFVVFFVVVEGGCSYGLLLLVVFCRGVLMLSFVDVFIVVWVWVVVVVCCNSCCLL